MEMDHDALPMDHGGHGNKKDAASVSSPPSSDPFFYRGRMSGVEWDDDMAAMNEKSDGSNLTWKMIDAVDGKENMKIN